MVVAGACRTKEEAVKVRGMELASPSATSGMMVKVAGQLIAAAPMLAIRPAHGLLSPRVTLSGSASVTLVSSTGPVFVRVMVRGMSPDCTDARVLFVTATRSAATFIVTVVSVAWTVGGLAAAVPFAPALSVTELPEMSAWSSATVAVHVRLVDVLVRLTPPEHATDSAELNTAARANLTVKFVKSAASTGLATVILQLMLQVVVPATQRSHSSKAHHSSSQRSSGCRGGAGPGTLQNVPVDTGAQSAAVKLVVSVFRGMSTTMVSGVGHVVARYVSATARPKVSVFVALARSSGSTVYVAMHVLSVPVASVAAVATMASQAVTTTAGFGAVTVMFVTSIGPVFLNMKVVVTSSSAAAGASVVTAVPDTAIVVGWTDRWPKPTSAAVEFDMLATAVAPAYTAATSDTVLAVMSSVTRSYVTPEQVRVPFVTARRVCATPPVSLHVSVPAGATWVPTYSLTKGCSTAVSPVLFRTTLHLIVHLLPA